MKYLKQLVREAVDRLPDSGHVRSIAWAMIILGMLAAGVVFSVVLWDWLRPESQSFESNGTTIRNIALVIGGAIALVFAVWRSGIAQRQSDIAQQGLLNERYQKGAEMLGSEVLSVRLAGFTRCSASPRSIQGITISRLCACSARS